MARTYEMLWDCPYCGTRKLLGKTHRHCPGCGAPQDPEKRYFPTEAEKVAVENHAYVGADRRCQACDSPMSAKASHCTQCGSPMEGATEVRRISDAPEPPPRPVAALASPRPRRRVFRLGCLGVLAVVVLGILVTIFWKREVLVDVSAHAWERRIRVEAFGPQQTSAWCDQMPRDAYGVSRSSEVRSHRDVPDGEDCVTQRVDNGDGTFSEHESCSTRYRQEPIYDDRCHFTVDRWAESRVERSQGRDRNPTWPQLTLRSGSCRGCEREGGREASYKVRFSAPEGKSFECAFHDEARWRRFEPGSRWQVSVRVVTGGIACDSLQRAQ